MTTDLPSRYPPINPRCPRMLHGGDYNPDQWIRTPQIWDEDMRLMKLAGCNAMSIGIFSWAALEPEEGRFEFGWLDTIMDKLADNDAFAVLATPSGARPAWMSEKYPEVGRMNEFGVRALHRGRHNHCSSSPVYRQKCATINGRLAERYKDHPALLVWHLSNEYNAGACHCEYCYAAFEKWLRVRYDDDLDKLNHEYWSGFWSHTYADWKQVRPVDGSVHALMIDWRRFLSDQLIDFCKAEIAPLREHTPDVPVTTNLMTRFVGIDYYKFARELDVVSWDSYPEWHNTPDDVAVAADTAFVHDMYRSMRGGQPFMLMESVPSIPTRPSIKRRKRPGIHLLSSLQAIAHGSDTVQYFQWRKGRGGMEKFHGAVVDHVGHENTRVFRDVADVGEALGKLDAVVGTTVRPEVAIVRDVENSWAMNASQYFKPLVKYDETCISHYRPFWDRGIPVDVIDMTLPLDRYKLVIAPMLYMLREDIASRMAGFVREGGTLILTYWSGVVNENDLCFLGGRPGQGLRELVGISEEEIDSLHESDSNAILMASDNELGIGGRYDVRDLCGVIHAETADVLATYESDFYAGMPALTVKRTGDGAAYYMAARASADFLDDFYGKLVEQLTIRGTVGAPLPPGVTAQVRGDGERDFVFLLNYTTETQSVSIGAGAAKDLLTGNELAGTVELPPYGVVVLERDARKA